MFWSKILPHCRSVKIKPLPLDDLPVLETCHISTGYILLYINTLQSVNLAGIESLLQLSSTDIKHIYPKIAPVMIRG